MEDGSSSIDFLRRIVACLGYYRHFPAISADYAFHFIDRYLLGTGFAALSQLALSSPLFRPHHTKLGKQRRRAAQGKVFRYRHDDLFLPVSYRQSVAAAWPCGCGCGRKHKIKQVGIFAYLFLFSYPIYPSKQSVTPKIPYSTLIFQTASIYSIKCKFQLKLIFHF